MIDQNVFDRVIGEQMRARIAAESALAEALRRIAALEAETSKKERSPADEMMLSR